MADGIGCKCGAYSSNECACDVDWTPQELIDARSALAAAQEKIRKMALDALSAEGQLDEQVEELTADLARVTKERDAALADNKRLREALLIAVKYADPVMKREKESPSNAQWMVEAVMQEETFIAQALAATPASAVASIEARVLREAADWFDDKIERRLETWQAQELRRMADAKEKA